MRRSAKLVLALALSTVAASAVRADDCAPSKITASAVTGKTTVVFTFSDPGDDGATGTASAYEVRRSNSVITDTNWQAAPVVQTGAPAGGAGTADCASVGGLTCNTSYYFVLFFFDAAGNRSPMSNCVLATTRSCASHIEPFCP